MNQTPLHMLRDCLTGDATRGSVNSPYCPAEASGYSDKMQNQHGEGQERERVVPGISDLAAYRANCEAIDRLVGECRYPYIVAWGKFLGFTPETVHEYVRQAEADNAPVEAIQKFDDGWSVLSSIKNETNRTRVMDLAKR